MILTWYRYRYNFSYGPTSWVYEYQNGEYTQSELEDVVSELGEYNWSEQYRGFDVEILNTPTPELVENLIAKSLNNINYNIKLYNHLLSL